MAGEVVRLKAIAGRFTLQAWLQASTDDGFARQLVRFFETHRPEALVGAGDEDERVSKTVAWLAGHDGWLLVCEDATRACASLRELLAALDAGRGHVLLTSQEPLHEDGELGVTFHRRLEPFVGRPDLCKEVWSKMGVFACKSGSQICQ